MYIPRCTDIQIFCKYCFNGLQNKHNAKKQALGIFNGFKNYNIP